MKGSPVSEANQSSKYKTLFPVYWNHPAVAGITLWGYVEGSTWAAGTGLLNADGTEGSAMTWLKSYMESLPDVGYPFKDSGGINGTNQLGDNQFLSVYPNPASQFLQLSSVEGVTCFQLFNILGQPLISKSYPKSATIDISSLNSGIYLIRIRQKGSNKTFRFVKK
jgi:hypothetical protein